MLIRNLSYRLMVTLAFLVVLAVCLVSVSKASAASYFINNQVTCSDANAGTSSGSPWCNISNVTGKTFAPGDQILLARGATWTSQTMVFTNSGTSGSYITLDAYGSGNKPKIVGTGLATDRAVKLSNASYWNISNLEISRVGAGIYFNYTTKTHEGINISNIYVHHVNGIVKGSPSNTDNIFFSSGIYFTGSGLAVGSTDYVVRNVSINGVEGTHNQDSIAIDWNNGSGLPGSTNPENAMQNLTLNHLYLHDDDGHDGTYQSNSCSDSLRFVGTNNATVMNSYLTNEASCFSSSGTAAIFSGLAKDIKYINNIISNVPNTGSPDLTGLDLETHNDSMKFYSNYWSGNAGAALELLLINGASDWCSNNDIGGNIFVGNGNGGVEAVGNGGGVTNATGTIHDNIYNGSTAFKTTNGGNFSGMTESNTVTIGSSSNIYSATNGFSGTQNTGGSSCTAGSNCWSYQLYNGSSYSNLSYDSTNVWWGSSTGNVSQFEELPNSTSTNWVARAWTAPSSGTVSIRGRVMKSDIGGGDGVKAKITKNGTVIWPTGGTPQTIAYNDMSGYDAFLDSISVTVGDVIRFEINNGGSANSSNDATSWAPAVAYTSITGGGENLAYDWGFASTSEGWTNGNQISQSVSSGINTITSSGSDPYMYSPDNLGINATTYKYVKVKMKNNTTSATAQVFFTTTADTTFTEAKSIMKTVTTSDSGYTEYIYDFSAVSGWTGTIKQLRFDPVAGSGTVDIDYIRVSDTGSGGVAPTLANAGFETPSTTNFTMGPMTNGWTFDSGGGVQTNGSAFGASTAPEGVQTALVQSTGSFYQAVTFTAGTYKVNLQAAKRTTYGGTQSFDVYYDSTVIGSFTPSSGSFTAFSTNSFTATAGSHTIKFIGTTTADNTDFIDAVSISVVNGANPSGTGIELDVTNDSSATSNRYIYKKFSNVSYTFQTGDYIEYDVKLLTNTSATGGLDIYNSDGSYFRDSTGWTDQNGVGGHPGSDLTTYAYNLWFHRKLAVPSSMIGKTSSHWDLVGENDTASQLYKAQYDNIVVTRSGSTVATAFASSGDYNTTGDFLTAGVSSSSITTPSVP